MRIRIYLLINLSINFILANSGDLEDFKKQYFFNLSEVPSQNFKRVGSYPYIAGDTFRNICHHIYDETDVLFDTAKIKDGDLVFVNTHFLDLFIKYEFNKIKNRFFLITHNSNIACPSRFIDLLENNKVILWFGNNPDCNHVKFIPLPLGLANLHWAHGNINLVKKIIQSESNKKHLLISNFTLNTNISERGHAYNHFINNDYCYFPKKKKYNEYLQDLRDSKFCLNPFGSGKDCHRLWEALLLDCYPITKKSFLDSLYVDLPVIVVNEWKEVTQEFLEEKYLELSKKNFLMEKVYFDYWKDLVFKYRADYLVTKGIK